jgi:hypothetical protein
MPSYSFARASLAALAFAAANVHASPVLALNEYAFGDHVRMQLGLDGKPVYMPTIRYATSVDGVALQYEFLRDSPQTVRAEFATMPVIDLGEMAPGTYELSIEAQNVDPVYVPASHYRQMFTVDAPSQPGIYTVPQRPDTSGQTRLVIAAGTGIDARSVRVSVGTGTIRVDYRLDSFGMATSYATVALPPLPAGAWHIEAWATSPYGGDATRSFTRDLVVQGVVPVVEYLAEDSDHYFVTSSGADVAALDRGDYGPWLRTGQRFKAWGTAADASGSKPVCRFYSSGSNAHFFTMDGSECDRLKALQKQGEAQAQALKAAYQGWKYEGVAFYAVPAQNGQCPSTTTPVYRFTRQDAAGNPIYRFTDAGDQRVPMQATWTSEGVAFCSPA